MRETQWKVNPAFGSMVAVCIFLLGGAAGNLVWKGEISQAQKTMSIDLTEIKAKLDYITELRSKTLDLERRIGVLERKAGVAGWQAGQPYLADGKITKDQ
jgi:hypothetical protein